jgi:DNA-binding ferritin-like protein
MPTPTATQTTESERRAEFGEPWRPQQMIEENPIGLSDEAVEDLIPKLDEIQCTLWTMYHQYHKHHWLVEGPQFRDLHLFLEENYEEVHKYLDRIAERVTALGGIPTSAPDRQAELSHVTHEPEGTYRIRQMLQHDLNAERTLCKVLRETAELALEHGDRGTKRQLEKVLTAAEDRAHHLDHFLGEDSLDGETA